MYSARVLADSVSRSARLTTLEVTFPRLVLSEFNTHRVFSRNSASSRAIPVEKQIQRVKDDPFIPEAFGKNQRGMQSSEDLNSKDQGIARRVWLLGIERAIDTAQQLADSEVHKQWANRVLEPYTWQTVIVSATDWDNFFKLRISEEAQPEIHKVAMLMRDAISESVPRKISVGDWHLPFITKEDRKEIENISLHPMYTACMVSSGRCARVSYLTHDGKRDLNEDFALASRLMENSHWSPFEHVATPLWYSSEMCANFRGWRQFRKEFETNTIEYLLEMNR